MSSVDKTVTNSYYDIEIDPETKQPVSIHVVILTGAKGQTETKGTKIIGGMHVAFHFRYELSRFGEIERPKIPPEAYRLLAKI